jgi:hypothetical protein
LQTCQESLVRYSDHNIFEAEIRATPNLLAFPGSQMGFGFAAAPGGFARTGAAFN